MQEKLMTQFYNLRDWWNNLDRTQKIRLALIAASLMIVLWITIFLATRPRMVVLFSNESLSTIGEIQNALEREGIRVNITQNGTAIEVPERDVSTAKIYLAQSNLPVGNDFTYQDALNASGMGATETVKMENFKRLKESDLSRDVRRFEGVRDASVQLVIPRDDNYFLRDQDPSSASVVLELSRPMDKTQAHAIARFVTRSVKGLEMENVLIVDSDANVLYSGMDSGAYASVSSEYEMELLRKTEVDAKVKASLAPLYDNVQAIYNLVLNWDKSEIQSETFRPPIAESEVGVPQSERIVRENVETTEAAAEPGLGANDLMVPGYLMGGGGAGSASVNNRDTDYLYDTERRRIETGMGDIRADDSSISIFVYKYRQHDEKKLMDNGDLDEITWDQFKEENQIEEELEIPPNVIQALRAGTGIPNLEVVGYTVPVFIDYEPPPTQIEQIIIFAILALLILLLAYGLIRKTQPDEITEVEPELSVEDLLVSTQLEEQREAEAERLEAIDFGKESEVKRQIEKFINEKPEAVGQLLRNWLNNEWE